MSVHRGAENLCDLWRDLGVLNLPDCADRGLLIGYQFYVDGLLVDVHQRLRHTDEIVAQLLKFLMRVLKAGNTDKRPGLRDLVEEINHSEGRHRKPAKREVNNRSESFQNVH